VKKGKSKENNFLKKHPVLVNALFIVGTGFILVYISLLLIDVFTEHGKYKIVPDVKNMLLRDAITKIENDGFRWEISDSVYNDNIKPGEVVEQTPKGNSRVKSNRIIYIGINAMQPRTVAFPNIQDISVRQGQAILEGLGFKNIKIETVSSPYKGLIIYAKINGLQLSAGKKLPVSSTITLVIGDGMEPSLVDSLSISDENIVEEDIVPDNGNSIDFMQ
jgi:pasta domain protein